MGPDQALRLLTRPFTFSGPAFATLVIIMPLG